MGWLEDSEMNPIWISVIVSRVLRRQPPRDVSAQTQRKRWLRNRSVGSRLRSAWLFLKDTAKRVRGRGVVPRATRVVTGMRGRSWLTGMLIGTTAGRIMQDSPCSVVAGKLEGWRLDIS